MGRMKKSCNPFKVAYNFSHFQEQILMKIICKGQNVLEAFLAVIMAKLYCTPLIHCIINQIIVYSSLL